MKPVTARNKDLRKFAIIPIKAVTDPEVTRTAALSVLAALCSYCDEAGCTFVSQARLAKDLGTSRQAINKQIRKLIKLKYVVHAKNRFKGQTTNTLKVIFGDVKTEEEALANLTARERISLEERRSQVEQEMQKPVDKSEDNNNVSTNQVAGGATSEVAGGETNRVAHNTPYNRPINNIREDARKICVMFLRVGESLGSNRVINERDMDVAAKWVKDGLNLDDWGKILESHAKYCVSKHRDYARGIGYFQVPVSKQLGKSVRTDVNDTITGVVKRLSV
jgi:DNA-binding Lrp family transcriptional regulator|tara:strand:+ start:7688 stop:8521 length:834 start_codon:yes stop_codon:yes gene_type:complete